MKKKIKEEDVKAAIAKLPSNSAGGADGLASRIVKLFKDEMLEPFRLIFNNLLSTGEQLENEYSTVCCPLLKPNKPSDDPKSYRSISLC